MIKKYYLLLVRLGKEEANVYLDEDFCKWLARQQEPNKNIVLINKWRISRRQFNAFKNAQPKV